MANSSFLFLFCVRHLGGKGRARSLRQEYVPQAASFSIVFVFIISLHHFIRSYIIIGVKAAKGDKVDRRIVRKNPLCSYTGVSGAVT